jgi:arylsulfatase A-like enzyme
MEWLFFVTKPSFMDAMPVGKKLEVFLLTGFVLVLFILPGLFLLRVLAWIPGPWKKWRVFLLLGGVPAALFLSATSLLMVDNFTYTLFKVGIVSTRGVARAGYALLAILLVVLWYRQVLSGPGSRPVVWRQVQAWLVIVLMVASLGIGMMRVRSGTHSTDRNDALLTRQPNILLLGGEGVVAKRMSLYGYQRDTTPRLRQLSATSLWSENHFTNASHTTGSVFSILTGKYPAQTRLLFSPNILHGEDAYQHLPGILQRAGYATVEITFPYYIDAYDVNMQDGFDEVNGRSIGQGELFHLARDYHFEDVGYFLPQLSDRVFDRVLHISFVREMEDPYGQVIQAVDPNTIPQMSDEARIGKVIHLLRTSDRPVFVHTHLMGTHGGMFYPRRQVFSAGEDQDQEWMADYYDDAVLDFDAYVGEVVDALERNHLLDQTILVVYSDHADRWRNDDRIPLLIRFPNGEFAGRLRSNTQNLDIAPTLLDYLGMQQPAWMHGQSLLPGDPDRLRAIVSADVVGVDCRPPDWWCVIDPALEQPPFYQFGSIQVVVCQKMYTLDLYHDLWREEGVDGQTAPCKAGDLPDREHVRQIILDHLSANGFDVSSLK